MTRLIQMPRVEVDVNLKLTMVEAQALDALSGYGIKPFLEVFYTHMGKNYLEPHEAGLVSLFETIRGNLPPIIERYKKARTAFALHDPVVMNRSELDERLARERKFAIERAAQGAKP